MSEAQYYVSIGSKTTGPFTIEQLGAMYAGGTIDGNSQYCTTQMQNWLPIATIAPLFPQASTTAKIPGVTPSDIMCPSCLYAGPAGKQEKGSALVLGILVVLAIMTSMGLLSLAIEHTGGKDFLFSLFLTGCFIWLAAWYNQRRRKGVKCCPACQNGNVIPATSPAAARILASR